MMWLELYKEEMVVGYSGKVSFSFPEAIVGWYTLPFM